MKCGLQAKNMEEAEQILDVHHISPRKNMPFGGYVLENGISLCKNSCHIKAEQFYSTGVAHEGFSVENLYSDINSNYDKAIKASKILIN